MSFLQAFSLSNQRVEVCPINLLIGNLNHCAVLSFKDMGTDKCFMPRERFTVLQFPVIQIISFFPTTNALSCFGYGTLTNMSYHFSDKREKRQT